MYLFQRHHLYASFSIGILELQDGQVVLQSSVNMKLLPFVLKFWHSDPQLDGIYVCEAIWLV